MPITVGVLSPVTGGFYYGKIVAGVAREVAAVSSWATCRRSGLIVKLGRWVITEVCRQIAVWQRTFHSTVNVSINLAP